jgi:endoglucanase
MKLRRILATAFALLAAIGIAAAANFVPPNPPEMKRLTNTNSRAYQTAKLFMRGVNLGDYLEAPPNHRYVTVSADEFAIMRKEGFDHVRVPIGWQYYTGPAPDFTLSHEIFAQVDFVVTNALANHLAVLINIHHFNDFTKDPAGQTEKFLAMWRQIAAHYKTFPNTLAFELLNEPMGAATTKIINPIYAKVISEIRKTNPHRTIFLEPGNWGGIDEIKDLMLPADDDNIIVSAHCYEPFFFTHQGASWAGPDVKATGIQFPGPPSQSLVVDPSVHLTEHARQWISKYNTLPADENPCSARAFTGKLEFARAWSDYYGRPVHIGEFGCYIKADPASRARFYSAFRHALDDEKLGWAIWDWSANFRYWDKKNNRPMPGMREALFGK